MKRLKKLTKALLLVLISSIMFCTTNTNAVDQSIQLGNSTALTGYVSGVKFSTKTKSNGELVYCLNMNKSTARNITANLVGERDAGVAYIIANGYPYKSFTGDSAKDYYITQSALWWYLDNTTGSSNLSQKFKTTGSDSHNLRPTIKSLVQNAEAARAKGYAKTSLAISVSDFSMSLKDEYFISQEISASTYSNISSYTVSLTNAPAGTQTIDASGNAKSTFGVTEKFRVRVPANAVKSTETEIKVTAKAQGQINKAYEYQPTNQNMQSVTPATLVKEVTNVTANLTLEIESSKVSIIKTDKTTGNAIAGATLVLKDSKGEEITRWTSTTNEHIIRNLPNDTYTITEVEAPKGYILNKTPVEFKVTNTTRDVKVKIENTPRVSVVNILKIDKSTQQPLAGAVLLVKDSAGNEVAKFTSTTEPYVLTDLENGTYVLEEITAPAGYMFSSEKITFTINDENLSHQIIFENHPEIIVPDTDSSSIIITILGIAMIGLGIRFVYKNGKKSK